MCFDLIELRDLKVRVELGVGRLQWGKGSGWRHIFNSTSLTAVTATQADVVLAVDL